MLRFLLSIAVVLLMADYAFAQDPAQCEQVRAAAAQYGYAAARRHAMATYGPEAVRTGDLCFAKHHVTRRRHATKHRHQTRHG
jgi:hypothetical protein